ncbi:succinate dehydrogenase [Cavenderia fasciculata]|uniref:Succinate dehydrogenase n=1 Tax=Cavenderia fasciculata TaxID=261658 RepID=F4PIK3_CACFS|nr:succinate dehydrogenase [Cavenderia fasciculata]EGG24583.1 succinate dehydrogenase [Cavenderia fasciculata]|eukprot:XP_004362434.1 succinate dehydrogenase [Cavenderia fasciculata]
MIGRTILLKAAGVNTRLAAINAAKLTTSIKPSFNSSSSSSSSSVQRYYSSSTQQGFKIVETKAEDLPKNNRPTSPHLTIYKLPQPAILSITHRATGIAMGLGLFGLAGLAITGTDIPLFIEQFKTLYPSLVIPTKFCVAFPVAFHSLSGVRHLVCHCHHDHSDNNWFIQFPNTNIIFWDATLKGIEVKSAETSGWIIVGVATAISLVLSFVTISSA